MNIKINYTNKKIQDVTTKDVVVSFDIENDNFRHNPVVETHTPIVEKDRQIKFTCDDGTTFTTSTSHPACYLNSFNKWDYKQSGDVILGDIFKSSKNIETKVVDICVDLNEDPQFYDITVDNDNNYLAGDDIENMAVVHNSSTVYVPFWHKEILDVLVLKNNKGTDDNRVRKLDYNIQFNRLFYKRVVEKGDITLFSPADAPSLYEAFFESNEKFEELYLKMENNKNIKSKKIKAVELFNSLIQERIGTGRIYVMNVDHVNSHSAFLDKVYMSNLCLTGDSLVDIVVEDVSDVAISILEKYNLDKIDNFYQGSINLIELDSLYKELYIQSYKIEDNIFLHSNAIIKVKSKNLETNDVEYCEIFGSQMTNESAEIFKITDDSGYSIECTGDHKIYTTNRGWVMAKDLLEDDVLDICG